MLSKKFLVGAGALSMSLVPTGTVLAAENEVSNIPLLASGERTDVSQEDANETGTIEIQLEKSQTATDLSNVQFGIVQVAELKDGEYVLINEFKNAGIDLNSLTTADDLQKAANKLTGMANTPTLTAATNSTGLAKVQNLNIGVYLITVINSANYDDIKPTLVSIPTYDETVGDYSYEISVEPKHSAKPKPENPNTGVETNTNEYLALLGASLAMVGVMGSKKLKEDGE